MLDDDTRKNRKAISIKDKLNIEYDELDNSFFKVILKN